MLVVSDVHIGKSSHFRKHGLLVPEQVGQNNFWKLSGLIQDFGPAEVLFLGDLSHSSSNNEWNRFVDLRMNFPAVKFSLVPGNHDILSLVDYEEAKIEVLAEQHQVESFIFSHDALPESEIPVGRVNLYGHLHPGVRLSGSGRQSLRLPCFYLEKKKMVLPAFGDFTGKFVIKPKKGSRTFVTTEEEVIEVR